MTTIKKMTREEWLHKLAKILESHFNKNGYKYPQKYRISCGLPSIRALSASKKSIGQCWHPTCSNDGTTEIFISPTISNKYEVANTLIHELCHAVVGVENGHNKVFKVCATKIGLEGNMTATKMNGILHYMIENIFKNSFTYAYPHAELNYVELAKKKQTTRLVKVVCENPICDFFVSTGKMYSVRMSRQVLEYGAPMCGCCGEIMSDNDIVDEKKNDPNFIEDL